MYSANASWLGDCEPVSLKPFNVKTDSIANPLPHSHFFSLKM